MAADVGRRRADLTAALGGPARRFELLAAVRALEAAGVRPIRFRAPLAPTFPPGDVEDGEKGPDGAILETAILSLFGPGGPLPAPWAEAARRRFRAGDAGPRAFLDLFGDRLIRAFIDMMRLERPSAATGDPAETPMAAALRALAGADAPPARPAGMDRALLAGAGLLHRRPQSLHAAARLIEAALGAPTRARGLVGGWTPMAEGDRALVSSRSGARLGRAALGRAVWLQEARVAVEIGPVGAARFEALLPGGPDHARLRGLVDRALPPEIDVDCRLTVAADERPAARLGAGAWLGWSSWLAPRAGARAGTATFRLRGTAA